MTETSKPKIAFLGTGLMGAPMCRCLLQAGFKLTVWNRSIAKAEALEKGRVGAKESTSSA